MGVGCTGAAEDQQVQSAARQDDLHFELLSGDLESADDGAWQHTGSGRLSSLFNLCDCAGQSGVLPVQHRLHPGMAALGMQEWLKLVLMVLMVLMVCVCVCVCDAVVLAMVVCSVLLDVDVWHGRRFAGPATWYLR